MAYILRLPKKEGLSYSTEGLYSAEFTPILGRIIKLALIISFHVRVMIRELKKEDYDGRSCVYVGRIMSNTNKNMQYRRWYIAYVLTSKCTLTEPMALSDEYVHENHHIHVKNRNKRMYSYF